MFDQMMDLFSSSTGSYLDGQLRAVLGVVFRKALEGAMAHISDGIALDYGKRISKLYILKAHDDGFLAGRIRSDLRSFVMRMQIHHVDENRADSRDITAGAQNGFELLHERFQTVRYRHTALRLTTVQGFVQRFLGILRTTEHDG